MSAAFIGLDLAKSVFQVHGVDGHGKVVVTKRPRQDAVLAFFANLPPCVVGMEACAGSHFWAREIARLGYTVRLMAPQYVKPTSSARRTTGPMPKLSAKRCSDRACGLSRSRPTNSRGRRRSSGCARRWSPGRRS
jgi:hypothetical protein